MRMDSGCSAERGYIGKMLWSGSPASAIASWSAAALCRFCGHQRSVKGPAAVAPYPLRRGDSAAKAVLWRPAKGRGLAHSNTCWNRRRFVQAQKAENRLQVSFTEWCLDYCVDKGAKALAGAKFINHFNPVVCSCIHATSGLFGDGLAGEPRSTP